MSEKIIQFGPENNMIGIVSEPENIELNRPAIMILNSGLIHKVGPYCMGVTLARKLAEQGFLVFRFDLPNIGDSTNYKTRLSYKERTVNEISSAMDIITKRYKSERFVSIGLCTGAMNSHIIAASDPRIAGAVLLDAYAYPTLQFLIKRYSSKIHKIFRPETIFRLFKYIFKNKNSHADTEELIQEEVGYWEQPPKDEIKNDLEQMMSRNIDLLYIYSGGVHYVYNYEDQLRDSFKKVNFNNHLDVYLLNEMDHTYTLQKDRNQMLSLLILWVQAKFSNYKG